MLGKMRGHKSISMQKTNVEKSNTMNTKKMMAQPNMF